VFDILKIIQDVWNPEIKAQYAGDTCDKRHGATGYLSIKEFDRRLTGSD